MPFEINLLAQFFSSLACTLQTFLDIFSDQASKRLIENEKT